MTKPHRLLTILATLLTATIAPAQTVGTPGFDPLGEHLNLPKQVRIIVEWVEMPHEEFTKLLEPSRNGADDTDLRKKAKKLIKKEKARVLETMVITTTPGQRAKTESILEKIYPTEYDPPEISAYDKSTPAPKPDAKGQPTGKGKGKALPGNGAVTPPNPTAFDVRNVGSTIEVEPNIDADNVTVSLNIAPEITYHCGDDSHGKWKTREAQTEVTQPRFYTMKCQTNVNMIAGKCHMACALSPQDEDGNTDTSRKVLMFIRCDILAVGK